MLNRSASLAMSTNILKALPGNLDIKRHETGIQYEYDNSSEWKGLKHRRIARRRPRSLGFTIIWAFTLENLTSLHVNNKGADQAAQSDQHLCYWLSER